MAKFTKGQSGNPNGRPKGSRNRTTIEIKEAVQALVDNNIDKIQADLNGLEARERIDAIIKLMQFVLPKQQHVENTHDIGDVLILPSNGREAL